MRRRLALLATVLLPGLAPGAPALAESNSLGIAVTTERAPDDFNATKSTDWQLSYAHSFDNNVILGGSAKYYDTAHTSAYDWNVEGDLGYAWKLDERWTLTGTGAIGGHLESDGPDFPYYSITGALALKLTETLSWMIVSYRYRNAFDTAYGYETPELATQLDVRLTPAQSVSFRIERDWKNGEASYNGLELGYKYHF